MPRIRLQATFHGASAAASQHAQHALKAASAIVLGAQRLGGLALVFEWEQAPGDGPALAAALRAAGVQLAEPSLAMLEAARGAVLAGSLHVNVVHDGPDEAIEVPAVPG